MDEQDMKAYLAVCASDFRAARQAQSGEWERERHTRIVGKKDRIQLALEKIDIEVKGSIATAKFLQRYKVAQESINKTPKLARVRGGARGC